MTTVTSAPQKPKAQKPPTPPPKKKDWRRFFKGRFLILSIAFHVLLGVVATYLVVQTFTPRKQVFAPGPRVSNPNQKMVEHKVSMAKKQKTMSAPAPTKRITTKGASKVVLPEMPDMPTTTMPTKGMGAPGTGFSSGGKGMTGVPSPAAATMPFFGLRTAGVGLKGTFYDLKQTAKGRPNELDIAGGYNSKQEEGPNTAYREIVQGLIESGMKTESLSKYFTGPSPLYTTQICIPLILATEAPKAFNLERKVKERRWFVIYSGKVTAPVSGRYRFAGAGDDHIAIKFGNDMVMYNKFPGGAKGGYYNYKDAATLAVGDTFRVSKGVTYPMEILIGEQPGGAFLAFLFLEKVDEKYEKTKEGTNILPLFKLTPSKDPKPGKLQPPVAPDTPWSVWKTVG